MHLPSAIYKKLLGVATDRKDLCQLHPAVGKSLQQLLDYEGNDFEEVFCLTFEITKDHWGNRVAYQLIPEGNNVAVTQENKQKYVDLYTSFELNESVESNFTAFKDGFLRVIGGNALSLFKPSEIELLIAGEDELDLTGLEAVTIYDGGFSRSDPIVQDFWNLVLSKFNDSKKRKFLIFCTGTDRVCR